jgi:hypothetical protein
MPRWAPFAMAQQGGAPDKLAGVRLSSGEALQEPTEAVSKGIASFIFRLTAAIHDTM